MTSRSQFLWDPAIPPVAIVALGLGLMALAAWTYLATGPRLGRGKRLFLLFWRLVVIAMLCLLLAQPSQEITMARVQSRKVAIVGIDTSGSMKTADAANQTARLDAARELLQGSGLLDSAELTEVRLFSFDEHATPIKDLAALRAEGPSTRIHASVVDMLDSVRPAERPVGLFLFTDGRDFGGITAARTAQTALTRMTPVFPVPVGRVEAKVDVAVHISSNQPTTFIRQRARIQATLRGTAGLPVRVQLLRQGQPLRDQRITIGTEGESPVGFEVAEELPGQYEFEVRAAAAPGETELANNSAFTYLNVSDARLRALLLEGEPHWDTTFLQRTLARNDRISLDAIAAIGKGQPLSVTAAESGKALAVPEKAADFMAYPLVILGRGVERILPQAAQKALVDAVNEQGVTVVFARGPAVAEDQPLAALSPAAWIDGLSGPVRVVPGRSPDVLPRDVLSDAPRAAAALPELPQVRSVGKPKDLTAVEAVAEDARSTASAPAVLHRRQGAGQVLAVAVEGLWKWSLHAKSEPVNNVYDRFWNQLLLNLVARSGSGNGKKPQLTLNSANIVLGEKVRFTLYQPDAATAVKAPVVTVYDEATRLSDTTLAEARPPRWEGEIVAAKPGRYRAEVQLPSGPLEARFAVFEEHLESTDTALDLPYLEKLATGSGGRVLDAAGLNDLVKNLRSLASAEASAPPIVRRRTLWDRTLVFWLFVAALGFDWFFRRRWGLT